MGVVPPTTDKKAVPEHPLVLGVGSLGDTPAGVVVDRHDDLDAHQVSLIETMPCHQLGRRR